jgi:RNA polymerase sigma-70 factor, ECF subfamily
MSGMQPEDRRLEPEDHRLEPDDRRLVEDASRGDATAVEGLLARFLPDLRRFVEKRAGTDVLLKESGADLVQSVCRELFTGLRDERFEYRGEREFKQWLYGAAVLKIEGHRRRWRAAMREAGREERLPSEGFDAALSISTTPSADAIRDEERERLRAAIAELPDHYREVVDLAHLQGLSHAEIAARLSITESNSRVLLARALARLATIAARPREA